MRAKIVAGNWKMNCNLEETQQLLEAVKYELKSLALPANHRVLVAPAFVNLLTAVANVKSTKVEVAAQNMHQAISGAFTGEVSSNMLLNIGVKTVILGHSERRDYFGENTQILIEKVNRALTDGLEVIFCFGEKLADRNNGKHFDVVKQQLQEVLFHLDAESIKKLVLAYEPVWAIGTGQTATSDQAQEMHRFVRNLLATYYTDELADSISILYGGSVKPSNAQDIFSKPDVDGGLIGGASLNATDFIAIIKAL